MFALFRKGSKLDLVALIISITLFVQLLMTRKLWVMADRHMPTIPLLKKLPFEFSPSFDYATIGAGLLLLLLVTIMRSKRYWLNLLFIWAALVVVLDVNRLQVWFYLFLLMVWILGFQTKRAENQSAILGTLRFVIIATYIWGGIHKLNIHFAGEIFPWLMSVFSLTEFLEKRTYFGLFPGIIELLIGIGLLFPKYWHRTFFLAASFHIVVLILLGPLGLGWNTIVWPWNIAMIALLYVLFPINMVIAPVFKDQVSSVRKFLPFYVIVLLLGILPFFNFFNLWDAPLSMTMYSGTTDEAEFFYHESDTACFPAFMEEHTTTEGDSRVFSINDWSVKELKVPFYAGKLMFKKMGRQLCDCLGKPEEAGIRIYSISGRLDPGFEVEDISCAELK